MRFSIFVALTVSAGLAVAQDASPAKAQDAFKDAGIPKDLNLPEFNPKAVLKVSFPQSSDSNPAPVPIQYSGAQLPPNNAQKPPTFGLTVPGKPFDLSKGPYVILAVDLDAPTPQDPKNGPVRHFLGPNFMLMDDGCTLANSTPAITEYQPPAPPQGSNPHRIVFFAYDQPSAFNDQKEVTSETDRNNFNISQFADKVGFNGPAAGSFMSVGPQN